ncbi:hypothetical protein [Mycolicibacterium nivoides]|uniref:hypothetical protein n=1 Tax=Mycolicibacterium nivoides TaxID=2487344 RepID=UPI0008C51C1C|nr:hypothetical protein [Mycolicibacterium nivoides]SEP69780.1 hypothetical protein SAMN04488583_0775 [Mycobacterium sp. 88mf]SFF11033.1 hypothetical protein SAMN04488582_101347 [Mycobacterium sp. 455mf]
MTLALRPYVTAGVALVGASIIAATPVAAPPPTIQAHAVQLTAAIDNPIEVFAPVFTAATTVVQNAVQAELDDPFPIVNGLVGKLLADGKTLGDMANALGQSYSGLLTALPGALTTYAQKIAAGDFTGAVGAFMPIAIGPFFTTFTQLLKFQGFVQSQFEVAGKLTNAAIMGAWSLGPGQLLSVYGVIGAVTGTLDELVKAVPTGDPAQIVNVVQHGIANIATKALGAVDMWRFSFDSTRQQFRDILNPPPPDPEELTTMVTSKVPALSLPTVEAPAIEAPIAEHVSETASGTTVSDPAASSATDATEADPAAVDSDTSVETVKPAVRESLVAVPGKLGTLGKANRPAAKVASDVRDGISATVNKIGENVKKAFAKPEKAPASASTGADKSSGTGNSGDAK